MMKWTVCKDYSSLETEYRGDHWVMKGDDDGYTFFKNGERMWHTRSKGFGYQLMKQHYQST